MQAKSPDTLLSEPPSEEERALLEGSLNHPIGVAALLADYALPNSPGAILAAALPAMRGEATQLGIPLDKLALMTPLSLAELITKKKEALLRLPHLAADGHDRMVSALQKASKSIGGRRKGLQVDGHKLKSLRSAAGFTQAQLAEACGVKMSTDTVQRAEKGTSIAQDSIVRIVAALSKKLGQKITPTDLQK